MDRLESLTQQHSMNLEKITRDIIEINGWRVTGKISREEHANMIATCDRLMSAYGWTWADIEAKASTL
jgi:hypothetical protein